MVRLVAVDQLNVGWKMRASIRPYTVKLIFDVILGENIVVIISRVP